MMGFLKEFLLGHLGPVLLCLIIGIWASRSRGKAGQELIIIVTLIVPMLWYGFKVFEGATGFHWVWYFVFQLAFFGLLNGKSNQLPLIACIVAAFMLVPLIEFAWLWKTSAVYLFCVFLLTWTWARVQERINNTTEAPSKLSLTFVVSFFLWVLALFSANSTLVKLTSVVAAGTAAVAFLSLIWPDHRGWKQYFRYYSLMNWLVILNMYFFVDGDLLALALVALPAICGIWLAPRWNIEHEVQQAVLTAAASSPLPLVAVFISL